MAKVKHHNAIISIFGDDAEQLLSIIGSTMQKASDEIETGVNSGYSVEFQILGAQRIRKAANNFGN